LTVGEAGPGLQLFDEKGRPLAWLVASEPGPTLGLTLHDEKWEHRAVLTVTEAGASLELFDEAGELRAWLTVGEAGASLELFDEEGDGFWSTPSPE
ncbi:MAG: hypothetical protein ABIP48_22380, partial [Planctomycetota bacterium]